MEGILIVESNKGTESCFVIIFSSSRDLYPESSEPVLKQRSCDKEDLARILETWGLALPLATLISEFYTDFSSLK